MVFQTNPPRRGPLQLAEIVPTRAPEDVFQRQRSERAAQAAAEFESLEIALRAALAERDQAINRANLIEEANKMVHERADTAERERDRLREENVSIRTKLRMAGHIILDALNPRLGPEAYAPPGSDAKLRLAVEETTEAIRDVRETLHRPHSFQQDEAKDDGAESVARRFAPRPDLGDPKGIDS